MANRCHFTLDAESRAAYPARPKRKSDVSIRNPQPALCNVVERLFGNDYACVRGGAI
jgi:hypothetical protein